MSTIDCPHGCIQQQHAVPSVTSTCQFVSSFVRLYTKTNNNQVLIDSFMLVRLCFPFFQKFGYVESADV